MNLNPQSAFDRLIGALEEFHSLASNTGDPETPALLEAADVLADAYTVYDDVMFRQYGVECPLDVYADEELDEDETFEFDGEEYDFDEDDEYEELEDEFDEDFESDENEE